MKETYTEVLCEASEDLIMALNRTPQRYIPPQTLDYMVSISNTINPCDEAEKEKIASKDIEGDAVMLIKSLDAIKAYIPDSINNCIRNLRLILKTNASAS